MFRRGRGAAIATVAFPLALAFFNRLSRGEIIALSLLIFVLLFFGLSGYVTKRSLSGVEVTGHVAALLLLCGVLTGIYAWHFWPRPSFALVGPTFFSPPQTWGFAIGHRGPARNEGVELAFTDDVLKEHILHEHQQSGTPLTVSEINSYTRITNVGEVDPLCRNHLFLQQFFWQPTDLDHEHYSLVVSSREIQVLEDIRIERVSGNWFYQAQIENSENGNVLLTCRDRGFPTKSDDVLPPCFPALTSCKE